MSVPSSSTSSIPPRSPRARQHPSSASRHRGMDGRAATASNHSSAASSSTASSSTTASELSAFLVNTFLPEVVPTNDEFEVKERARAGLQVLVERLWPGAMLKSFGSMANGFALKNSDMDLCCLLGGEVVSASQCVEMLGALIATETNYVVKMLPRARIPIIKLTIPPTPDAAWTGAISCDIGFENRLALENTRLLGTYAQIDPRVRAMVLFLKVWTKRRQVNNPYRGTLSSYGYVLLVIHFLAHVRAPPVLPNLQRLPPLRSHILEDLEHDGHDMYFFADLEALPRVWRTQNAESVGELLIEFFRYYSKEFNYASSVLSIRSETGILTKDIKGWHTQYLEYDPEVIIRDLHILCIEDPFQLDYNVARTVTKDGLYTIRGEFMRAIRVLQARPHDRSSDRISALITELCAERDDSLLIHPPPDRERERHSPRRQSAPPISPRLNGFASSASTPATIAAVSRDQSSNPPPMSMADFRLWAALNSTSNAAAEARNLTRSGLSGLDTAAPGSALGLGSNSLSPGARNGNGLDEAWEPSNRASFGGLRRGGPPQSHHLSSSGYARSQPASTHRAQPSLERRVSWDGSGSASGTFDLHRFFQAQPGDDRTSMTAPSSPDMGAYASSSANHFNGYHSESGGRPFYRYGGALSERSSFSNGSYSGQRMTSSVPPRSSRYSAPSVFADDELAPPPSIITFGTFPPPYSYASYASSSSNASPSSYAVSPATSYRTVGLLEEDDDDNPLCANERGRSPSVPPPSTNATRPRGRSVPHVRVDSDGKESILFGEISAPLPEPMSRDDNYATEESGPMSAPPLPVPTLKTQPPTPVKPRAAVSSSNDEQSLDTFSTSSESSSTCPTSEFSLEGDERHLASDSDEKSLSPDTILVNGIAHLDVEEDLML